MGQFTLFPGLPCSAETVECTVFAMRIYVSEDFRARLELVPSKEQGAVWALGEQQKCLLRAPKTFSTSLC